MSSPLDLGPRFPEGSLEAYAAELQELVLYLRREGHLLSSVDQHFIEAWWERGYPLDTVLDAVLEAGTRLLGRKSPPRGLPLKSMRRQVEKAGDRAVERTVGAHGLEPEEPPGDDPLDALRAELRAEEGRGSAARREALERARRSLEELPSNSGLSEGRRFTAVLAVSRRYYDALLAALDPSEQRRLRAEGESALGEAARRMSPDALEETLGELARRSLRSQDPVLDPDRLRRSWRTP